MAGFRSAAEVRWAQVFTDFGWCWEHEPQRLPGGYLPDFIVHGPGAQVRDRQMCTWIVEVKGGASTARDLEEQAWLLWDLHGPAAADGHVQLVAVGDRPNKAWPPFTGGDHRPFAAGLMWSWRDGEPVPATIRLCSGCGWTLCPATAPDVCTWCLQQGTVGSSGQRKAYVTWEAAKDGEQSRDASAATAASLAMAALDAEWAQIVGCP